MSISPLLVPPSPDYKNEFIHALEKYIFNVRWALIPFYLGLSVVLLYYGYAYFQDIYQHLQHSRHASIDDAKLFVLDAVDMVMVANLVKMIIAGSYNSFISKAHGYKNENVSSGELKIKISTSVVVLSMIHLLKSFIGHTETIEIIYQQLTIFGGFLICSLVLSLVEYLHVKAEAIKHHD